MKSAVALALALCFWTLALPTGLRATTPDSLAAAKAFYVAAEYEEALKILSAPDGGLATDEADVYRALCLLALGRLDEVEQVLRSLAARNPTFHMSETEVTPRLVALFQDVRRRALQDVAKNAYNEARTSFDAGRYAEAYSRFDALVTLLTREDAALDADGLVTRGMSQLARGFKDLASLELASTTKADAPAAAAANAIVGPSSSASPLSQATPGSPRVETLIEQVVQRYAQAFSALDADAVTQVFPGENARSLQDAFNRLKSQTIEARNVTIAVDPDGQSATVTLNWVAEAVPKIGSAVKVQRLATLRMSKTPAGDWSIVDRR